MTIGGKQNSISLCPAAQLTGSPYLADGGWPGRNGARRVWERQLPVMDLGIVPG
jgi:hypothetical protein